MFLSSFLILGAKIKWERILFLFSTKIEQIYKVYGIFFTNYIYICALF